MMGGFGMIFGGILLLLFTVGIGALVIFGIAWLLRNTALGIQPGRAPYPAVPVQQGAVRNCESCGQAVQRDWKHCAYCGSPME